MGNTDSSPGQLTQEHGASSSESSGSATLEAQDYLRRHLSRHGLPAAALTAWTDSLAEGSATAYSQELAREVKAGLCRLECDEVGALARRISIVEVTVTAPLLIGDAVLIEEEQILSNGRRVPRRHRPHVQLQNDEAPTAGATRALRQCFGLSDQVIDSIFPNVRHDEVLRDASGWMNGDTEAGSSNIPGLQTRYELHRIELPLKETSVPQLGLPDGDPFATVEETSPSSPSGSRRGFAGRQLHLWRWVPRELAGIGGFADVPDVTSQKEQHIDQDCASTVLEETYKDLQAVIKQLESQKATFAQQGRLGLGPATQHIDGMQERLRRVMTRISNVEELVHQVNIENVLSAAQGVTNTSSPSRRSSRQAAMGQDLRDFISDNFTERALFEASGDGVMQRPKSFPVSGGNKSRTSKRRATIGALPGRGRYRANSEPPSPSPVRSSSSSDDSNDEGTGVLSIRHSIDGVLPSRHSIRRCSEAPASENVCTEEEAEEVKPAARERARTSLRYGSSQTEKNTDATGCKSEPASCFGYGERLDAVCEASIWVASQDIKGRGGDQEWVLDSLALSDKTNSGSLLVVAEMFLMPQVEDFGTSPAVMRRFLCALHGRYLQNLNPFHNEAHVALVNHATRWLVTGGTGWHVAPVVEQVATDIAALGHDAGHFRRNNGFCVHTGHWLALTYNDRSVLENMHAATCFQLMNHNDRDILKPLDKESRKSFRDHMVDLILSTDMASHYEFLGHFRVSIASENFDPEAPKNRQMVTKCCLKAADLGHTALPWELHEPWVMRLLTEFYEQGDEERELGFPVSPMCSHSSDIAHFKEGQKGFLHFVVLPLYKELTSTLGHRDVAGTCISRIESNIQQWVEGELSPELIAVVKGVPLDDASETALKKQNGIALSWLPPSNTKDSNRTAHFQRGDEVWIMKPGNMRGKRAQVIEHWNGLVKVKTEKTEKGDIKTYHPNHLELAIAVPASRTASQKR